MGKEQLSLHIPWLVYNLRAQATLHIGAIRVDSLHFSLEVFGCHVHQDIVVPSCQESTQVTIKTGAFGNLV